MDAIEVLPERFRDEPGKTLADMLRQLKAETAQGKVVPPKTAGPAADVQRRDNPDGG
jgi:hypothetical protein